MKQYIITDLSEGLVNITADKLLEIGGDSAPTILQNLQSVLEQGSEAVIDNDFSVTKTNGNGKIAITEEGVKIEGQAKGVIIDGQSGAVNIIGNGVSISGQGNGVDIFAAKLNGNTFLESNLWFGGSADNYTAYLKKFQNVEGGNGFKFYSPGDSQIIIDYEKVLEINGNLKLSGGSLAVIEDPTFGLVLDNQNRIKRQLLSIPQATRPPLNTAFNTNDLIDGKTQYGREINLQNTSNIEITVKAGTFSTYFKGGNGTIKFVADTGRTLKLMDATETINGIVGSYAKVKSFGTVDYIYINNY